MMNSKCLTIAVLLLLCAMPLHAQRIKAYLTAGAAASQIEGDELKGFDKWGFTGGVGAIAHLTKNQRWLAGVEIDYMRRGARNDSGDPYNATITLDYVDVPLTVYYHDPIGGMMIGAGLVYGRLVQQPHGEMAFRDNYFIPDTSNLAFLKNDLAAALELRFAVWRGLMLSLRYQYSIIAVKKDWQFTECRNSAPDRHWSNNCYNSSAQLRLIWQF